MTGKPQTGLKINFLEYVSEVRGVVSGVTVKDLVTKLWGSTTKLSSSSSIKDIIFLTQNLYTLGGFVVGSNVPIDKGPLKDILDRVSDEHIETMTTKNPKLRDAKKLNVSVVFGKPRFYLEPDLNQKQIRIQMQVNGKSERLTVEYEQFFRKVLAASGDGKLNANTV